MTPTTRNNAACIKLVNIVMDISILVCHKEMGVENDSDEEEEDED